MIVSYLEPISGRATGLSHRPPSSTLGPLEWQRAKGKPPAGEQAGPTPAPTDTDTGTDSGPSRKTRPKTGPSTERPPWASRNEGNMHRCTPQSFIFIPRCPLQRISVGLGTGSRAGPRERGTTPLQEPWRKPDASYGARYEGCSYDAHNSKLLSRQARRPRWLFPGGDLHTTSPLLALLPVAAVRCSVEEAAARPGWRACEQQVVRCGSGRVSARSQQQPCSSCR